jgi:hypothetical protein
MFSSAAKKVSLAMAFSYFKMFNASWTGQSLFLNLS